MLCEVCTRAFSLFLVFRVERPFGAGVSSFKSVRSVNWVSVQPQSGELLAEEDVDEGVVLAGVVGVDGDLDGGFGVEVVDGDAGGGV